MAQDHGLKVVFGRRTVEEYLRSAEPDSLERLILCGTNQSQVNEHLSALARNRSCEVVVLGAKEFDEKARKYKFTQGVILHVRRKSVDEDTVTSYLQEPKRAKDLVLMLDHLEDVSNLGSILRSCGFYGVQLVIIPKDRAADITPVVEKIASGALAFVQVAAITNLNQTMETFKESDYWVVGTSLSEGSQDVTGFKWPERTLLVIGNEHKGLGRLVEKNCDMLVRIKGKGRIESLNAAVSTAVFLDRFFTG